MTTNPYRPPESEVRDPVSGATDEELLAFVGPNGFRYLEKWRDLRAGRSRLGGFSWPAFFAGPLWFVYRRLYWEAAVLFGIGRLSELVEAGLRWRGVGSETVIALATAAVGLAIGITTGLVANAWYYHKAERAVVEHRELAAIAAAGGVRAGAVWIALLVLVLLAVVFALAFPEGYIA